MTSQILLAVLPSVFMLAVIFIIFKSYLEKQFEFAKTKSETEVVFPLKVQAYERITLFLERIKLESLILRTNLEDFDNRGFHSYLLTEIRKEYNHNLAQQLYIKTESWDLVNIAFNSALGDINESLSNVNTHNESSKSMATRILTYPGLKSPGMIKSALDAIKKDFQNNF